MVWKKELGAEQALASIKVDPTDWRHICLCGAKGSIVVLRLTNMAQNKVGTGLGEGGKGGGEQQCKCKGQHFGATPHWSQFVTGPQRLCNLF